jgi:hypothetical protein
MTDHFVGRPFPSNGRLRSNVVECLPTISLKVDGVCANISKGLRSPTSLNILS